MKALKRASSVRKGNGSAAGSQIRETFRNKIFSKLLLSAVNNNKKKC